MVIGAGEQRTLRATLHRAPEREPRPAMPTLHSNVLADRVFIDDQFRGSTRLDLELDPGLHWIVVEKEGFIPFEKRIDLAPGQHLTLHAELHRPGHELGMFEELAHAWVQNAMNRNEGGRLALTILPFFLYGEIVHTEEQFLGVWRERVQAPDYPRRGPVFGVEPLNVPPSEAGHLHPVLAGAVNGLGLGDDGVFVRVRLTHECAQEVHVIMIFRRTDEGLKIVGICCPEVVRQ